MKFRLIHHRRMAGWFRSIKALSVGKWFHRRVVHVGGCGLLTPM